MPYLPALGLWLVTLRDGNVRQMTSGESSYVTPDVSRSGAIVVGHEAATDIWKFPVDGHPPKMCAEAFVSRGRPGKSSRLRRAPTTTKSRFSPTAAATPTCGS